MTKYFFRTITYVIFRRITTHILRSLVYEIWGSFSKQKNGTYIMTRLISRGVRIFHCFKDAQVSLKCWPLQRANESSVFCSRLFYFSNVEVYMLHTIRYKFRDAICAPVWPVCIDLTLQYSFNKCLKSKNYLYNVRNIHRPCTRPSLNEIFRLISNRNYILRDDYCTAIRIENNANGPNVFTRKKTVVIIAKCRIFGFRYNFYKPTVNYRCIYNTA